MDSMTTSNSVTLTVRIPANIKARLTTLASHQKVSVSEIVRPLLDGTGGSDDEFVANQLDDIRLGLETIAQGMAVLPRSSELMNIFSTMATRQERVDQQLSQLLKQIRHPVPTSESSETRPVPKRYLNWSTFSKLVQNKQLEGEDQDAWIKRVAPAYLKYLDLSDNEVSWLIYVVKKELIK